MEFYYRAITPQGERVSGTHSSRNLAAARKELAEQFGSILELAPADRKRIAELRKPYRVKPEQTAIFFRRMATLFNSGVPLADALNFMVASEDDGELSKASEHLMRLVLSGTTLSHSMRDPKFREMFDPVSVGMIALGEQTGQIAKIMLKLADLKERQLALTRSLVATLTYPGLLFVMIVLVGIVFTMILGNGSDGLFTAFGTKLPWPTKVMQSFASSVCRPSVLLGTGLVLVTSVLVLRRLLKDNSRFRLRVHVLLMSIPVLGPLLSKIECAKILYVMSDGIEVGLSVKQVLTMAREVCTNEKVRVELNGVLRKFSDGGDLTECLSEYDLFPPMILSMIEVGMESGNLDMLLVRARKGYEEDVHQALDSLARLAEPLLLSFAGFLAGFLAIATLLPIIKMTQDL